MERSCEQNYHQFLIVWESFWCVEAVNPDAPGFKVWIRLGLYKLNVVLSITLERTTAICKAYCLQKCWYNSAPKHPRIPPVHFRSCAKHFSVWSSVRGVLATHGITLHPGVRSRSPDVALAFPRLGFQKKLCVGFPLSRCLIGVCWHSCGAKSRLGQPIREPWVIKWLLTGCKEKNSQLSLSLPHWDAPVWKKKKERAKLERKDWEREEILAQDVRSSLGDSRTGRLGEEREKARKEDTGL